MTDIESFLAGAGWHRAARRPLAGDASARVYERLSRAGRTAVLMQTPVSDRASVADFLRIAEWLSEQGFSAPRIYAADLKGGLILMEDFGDDLMARLVQAGGRTEAQLYAAAGAAVIRLSQVPAPPGLSVLDAAGLVQLTHLAFDEAPKPDPAMRDAFIAAATPIFVSALPPATRPSLRDVHAGNIIWLPKRTGVRRIGWLDFQDAVMAPPGYDLASLVDDARRPVPPGLRARLVANHAAATQVPGDLMGRTVDLLSLVRNLRILGIFRRAARARGNAAYLDFLPHTAMLIRDAARRAEVPQIAEMTEALLAVYGLSRVGAA